MKNRKGQSTLEYGVLIALVVGGLITMQLYMKRGVQGRLRSATDDIGAQFSPTGVSGTTQTKTGSKTQTTRDTGGVEKTTYEGGRASNYETVSKSETLTGLEQEKW